MLTPMAFLLAVGLLLDWSHTWVVFIGSGLTYGFILMAYAQLLSPQVNPRYDFLMVQTQPRHPIPPRNTATMSPRQSPALMPQAPGPAYLLERLSGIRDSLRRGSRDSQSRVASPMVGEVNVIAPTPIRGEAAL